MSLENKGTITSTVIVSMEPDRSGNYVCDGTADGVQIQAAIDEVERRGGGTVHIKNGGATDYSLATIPLTINSDNVRLTGDTPVITIPNATMAAGARALLRIEASNIEVDHIVWDANGTNQSYDAGAGQLETHAVIEIYKFDWNTDNLIATSREFNVKVHHCLIKEAYHGGIAAMKFDNVHIYENTLLYCRAEYAGQTGKRNVWLGWCYDSEVRDNYCDLSEDFVPVSNNIHLRPAGGAARGDTGNRRVKIQGNHCYHSYDSAIEIQGIQTSSALWHDGIEVTGNIVWGRHIYMNQGVRNSKITDNVVLMDSDTGRFNAGIAVKGGLVGADANDIAERIIVANNVVFSFGGDNVQDGILIESQGGIARDIIVEGNLVYAIGTLANQGFGIRINGDAGNGYIYRIKIVDNIVFGCDRWGIYIQNLEDGDEIEITDNSVYNNNQGSRVPGGGIGIDDDGDFLITGNNVYDDQGAPTQSYGLYVFGTADDGIVRWNRFGKMDTGVYLAAGVDNWTVVDNEYDGCTTPLTDNAAGTVVNTLVIPFISHVSASYTDDGIYLVGAGDYARTWWQIPLYVHQVLNSEVWATSEQADANSMRIELRCAAGPEDASKLTVNTTIVNHPSTTTNFAANDVIKWDWAGAAIIGLLPGYSLRFQAYYEDAGNGDIATDAKFRTVVLHYV